MTMKLSENTVNLLKNFSSINQSILFKQGTKLRSISVMKNILVEANIGEEFPKDFGIYDLNQFLNGLSLHTNYDYTLHRLTTTNLRHTVRLYDYHEQR